MDIIQADIDGYVLGNGVLLPGVVVWYTADDAEAQQRVAAAWKDAPLANTEVLGMLLEIAREQVLEFAPELPGGTPLPTRFVWAQLQHAKHLWNAGRVNGAGDAGNGEFSFAPRPLDKDIQAIIRPRKGTASVF